MVQKDLKLETERLKSAMQVLDANDPAKRLRPKLTPFDVANARYAIAETGQVFSAVNEKGKLIAVPRDIVDIAGHTIYNGFQVALHIPLRFKNFASYYVFCGYRAMCEAQMVQERVEKLKWWNERTKIAKAFLDLREAKQASRCQIV